MCCLPYVFVHFDSDEDTVVNLKQVYSCNWITGLTGFQIYWIMDPRVGVAIASVKVPHHIRPENFNDEVSTEKHLIQLHIAGR